MTWCAPTQPERHFTVGPRKHAVPDARHGPSPDDGSTLATEAPASRTQGGFAIASPRRLSLR